MKDGEEHPNVFIELLNSGLPEKEKSEERLANEAVVMLAAGTETTAWGK
jgi:cytochrome P450